MDESCPCYLFQTERYVTVSLAAALTLHVQEDRGDQQQGGHQGGDGRRHDEAALAARGAPQQVAPLVARWSGQRLVHLAGHGATCSSSQVDGWL